jgi:type IV pilus assembly protein PilE
MKQARRQAGVTLIELMIVVTVVAILGAIAYPSYRSYTLRAARSEAKAALMNAAARQEQYYLDNKTYTTTVGSGGLNMSTTTENDYYVISVAAATASCPISTCYVLQATPQAGQADDTACATLTLDSKGARSATGTDPDNCW